MMEEFILEGAKRLPEFWAGEKGGRGALINYLYSNFAAARPGPASQKGQTGRA